MPIGVLTNCTAVLLGGLLGTALGKILPQGLKDNLPTLFGFCSIAIGVNSIIKASGMTAVVLAILVGFAIGHSLHLEQWTSKFFHKLVRTLHLGGGPVLLQRLRLVQHPDRGHHRRSSLLMSKAVLDGFTAMIFASTLGQPSALSRCPRWSSCSLCSEWANCWPVC